MQHRLQERNAAAVCNLLHNCTEYELSLLEPRDPLIYLLQVACNQANQLKSTVCRAAYLSQPHGLPTLLSTSLLCACHH